MSKPQPNYAGLAEDYSRNRPQYPQRMVANLRDLLPDGLRAAGAQVDARSGSPISVREPAFQPASSPNCWATGRR